MDPALFMEIEQGLRRLLDDSGHQITERDNSLPQKELQVGTFEQLQHQIGNASFRIELVDADDVFVLEFLADFEFVLQSPNFTAVFPQILAENFQGVSGGVCRLDGFPYSRRVTHPDQPGEAVGTEEIAGAGHSM